MLLSRLVATCNYFGGSGLRGWDILLFHYPAANARLDGMMCLAGSGWL